MRQLHQLPTNPGAEEAIDIFCRTAKKSLGAFIAILGGLDLLVFTGGIGEHDAIARAQICSGLESLGITLNPQKNKDGLQTISDSESRVSVWVMQTDEDEQIARHTYRLLLHSS
jgi:acetate kinase